MTMHRTFLFIATLILSTILTPSFAQNKTDRSTLLSEIETDLKENILSFWAENSVDPQTKHLVLFCDDEWNPLEEVHSYGHDIETSWLLSEAARATEDAELIEAIDRQAIEMTDTALKEGLNGNGAMIYEKNAEGYLTHLSWWPQCETVIGCINAWEITGDEKYFKAACRTWDYIKSHFIDKENGEWFKRLDSEGNPSVREPKASEWNCPYHNSRVGFEAIRRLAPEKVHTEVMAWSNITGVRMGGRG